MTSRRSVLIGLAVAIAAFAATHLLPIPGSVRALMESMGGQPIFDMEPSFSSDEVYERLAAFGEVGRAAYRHTVVTTDIIFPACVAAFLFLLARFTADRLDVSRGLRALLLALPIAYFLSDMTENVAIFVLLSDYPERHEIIGGGLGYLTVIKRAAQAASLLLPASLFLIHKVRQPSPRR
ncbi:MAG: hypothetical protein ABIP07_02755 [Sphingomicrobium sp.]